MNRYAETIEADFERYYQLDLLDHYRPGRRLSLRKIGVLISYLPPESATATAIRNAVAESGVEEPAGPKPDASKGQWDLTQLLLAQLIDEIRSLRYEYRQVNSEQPGQAPQPVERPGVVKLKPKMNTVGRNFLVEQRRLHEEALARGE